MSGKFTILISLLLINAVIFAQTAVTPVSDVKGNDATGTPLNMGKSFTVSGIVTSTNQFGSGGPATINDNTGSISIYGSAFAGLVQMGDSVTVTAPLTQYSGLTQLDYNTTKGASYTKHSSNHHFDTLSVTIRQMNAQKWDGVEILESALIRLNNVTFSASGSFEGNKSYAITDTSGTGTLYVKKGTTLVGTPIPSGKVDLIGILSQFKYAAPYNSGYQIMPRFRSDIVDDGRPLILNPVTPSAIDTASFTVFFSTAREGNSIVKYGLTQNLELDSVIVDSLSTMHKVEVTGLKTATRYYFKALSRNDKGTSESTLFSVTTAAGGNTTGTINIYFNNSVDTSVAIPDNAAKGNVDFQQKIIDRINAASYSIDMAVYSFDLNNVASALIAAKNRGVKIRVVYQSRSTQTAMQMLENAGVKVVRRSTDIMHNKFFVFDGRDNNTNNDWVWTGSWNVTYNELTWRNNVVEINDAALADAYRIEFEEMWGSKDDTPDPLHAKFGLAKIDNTPHFFNIGGRNIELYFSPSDQTESHIVNELAKGDSSFFYSILTFTSDNIYGGIKGIYNRGGKDIRGIIDNVNDNGSEFQNMKTFSEVYDHNSSSGTLHHKYGIIDAYSLTSDPVVITGSHNWSRAANEDNDENTLIIHDALIANQYMQEFKSRYNDAGGTLGFTVPLTTGVTEETSAPVPGDMTLYQNYPNPFNPVTTISFYMKESMDAEISVYNSLGQLAATIFRGIAPAGKNVVDFNASHLSSGVYIYMLKAGDRVISKKLLLLK